MMEDIPVTQQEIDAVLPCLERMMNYCTVDRSKKYMKKWEYVNLVKFINRLEALLMEAEKNLVG